VKDANEYTVNIPSLMPDKEKIFGDLFRFGFLKMMASRENGLLRELEG